MKDFDVFWNHYSERIPQVDKQTAEQIYNELFTCTCGSCTYRKEKGLMPIKSTHTACIIPADIYAQFSKALTIN